MSEPRIVPVRRVERKRTTLFYGRSGTGKTTLFGTYPGRKLLIDIRDSGTDSVSNIRTLDVTEITEWAELEDLYWWLKKRPGRYAAIGLDTATQMQDLSIEEESKTRGRRMRGKKIGDFGTLTMKEWGRIAGRMKEWTTNYRSLMFPEERGGIDAEVCFLAQDRVFNLDADDDRVVDSGIAPEVGPRLTPAVVTHLNAISDVIGCTFVRVRRKRVNGRLTETPQYCLRIGPNSVYTTKIRKPFGVELPAHIVDPTFEKIVALIKGDQ